MIVMKTYRDLCSEMREEIFEGYDQQRSSRVGKIKKSTYARSVRHNQLIGRAPAIDRKKFIQAINDGYYDKVLRLVGDGADVRQADDKGRTPLHFAVTSGNNNIVKMLIANGSRVNEVDCIGNTPLHLAVCTGQIGIVTTLLGAGADVTSVDRHGKTALHLANSRLRMIHDDQVLKSVPERAKKEISQVVEMMRVYFERARCEKSTTDELESLASRLSISESVQEVDEVQNMLENFTSLSLQKANSSADSSNKTTLPLLIKTDQTWVLSKTN